MCGRGSLGLNPVAGGLEAPAAGTIGDGSWHGECVMKPELRGAGTRYFIRIHRDRDGCSYRVCL